MNDYPRVHMQDDAMLVYQSYAIVMPSMFVLSKIFELFTFVLTAC